MISQWQNKELRALLTEGASRRFAAGASPPAPEPLAPHRKGSAGPNSRAFWGVGGGVRGGGGAASPALKDNRPAHANGAICKSLAFETL